MKELSGKKFIASYSGGKDSMLAIHRAIKAGLVPQKLIITYNTDQGRSWFHGIPEDLLGEISRSVGIPIQLIKTSGAEYGQNFESALCESREAGAEVCVFGDIDIDGHLEWCTQRCEKAGLIPCFPLWHEPRRSLVMEMIDAGFKAVITIVDTTRMDGGFLGRVLDRAVAEEIEASGTDICGENGEYHTFVFDGPLFANRISYTAREPIKRENYLILPIS